MVKIDIIINLINIGLSLLNFILATILQGQKDDFNSKTETSLIRYRFLENVLIEPYYKLMITALLYDILLYTSTFLLSKFFFKVSSDKNEENVRTKSMRENRVSNIFVEFIFTTMIKGLALGFGFFYVTQMDKEIKRILKVRNINDNQENVLNSMISIVIINGVSNILTIIYQFLFFGYRLATACKDQGKKNNNVKRRMTQEDKFKLNNIDKINKRHGIKKDKNVVGSFGSISLPEIEDDIKYQKIDG